MNNSIVISNFKQQCQRKWRVGYVCILMLILASPLSAVDLPPSPLEEQEISTQRNQKTEDTQRPKERIAIAPTCNADQDQWYITVNYRNRNRNPALNAWQFRFALAGTEGADSWQRDFSAIVHGNRNSIAIYDTQLPSMPTDLIFNNEQRLIVITDVTCTPYAPFPSEQNSTKIHHIDTDTIATRNDFAHPEQREEGQRFFFYRWSHAPTILIVDTTDYQTLGRLFNRLAFFIEKKNSAGTLYNDEELRGRFAWNGHNYNAADLARFYSAAEERAVTLNEDELQLRDILINQGIMAIAQLPSQDNSKNQYLAVEGGLIAISQQSSGATRRLILQHELLHALFYASRQYRAAVERVWLSLSDEERHGWRALLGRLTYDPQNEYVMMNEFQAYLLAKTAEASVSQMTAVARATLAQIRAESDAAKVALNTLIANNSASMRQSANQLAPLLLKYSGLIPGSLKNIHTEDAISTYE